MWEQLLHCGANFLCFFALLRVFFTGNGWNSIRKWYYIYVLEGLTLPFRVNAFILCLCGFDLDATTTRASKGWGGLYQSLVPPPHRWFLCCPVRSSARCVTRWGGAAVCRSYREAAGRGGAGGTAAGLLLSELQEAQRGGTGGGS